MPTFAWACLFFWRRSPHRPRTRSGILMPVPPLDSLAQLSEYARPGFWYGLLALIGVYLVLIFVAAIWERRPTEPYAAASPVAPGTPIHPYHAAVNERAAAAGFLYGGTFHHPNFAVEISFWISPDRLTLLQTGAGRIATRTVRQTDLFTRTSGESVMVTADYYGDDDPSGLLRYKQHYNGSLEDLLAMHARRVAAREGGEAAARPFAAPSPRDGVNAIYVERADRLVRAGRARWVGRDRRAWRYTLAGSLLVCRSFLTQLASALTRFWRRYRPRPGTLNLPQPLDPSRYKRA